MNPIIILYLKCLTALILGLVIHTGTKFNEVKVLHSTANETLTFKSFIKSALMSHIINLTSALLWLLVLPDLIRAVPTIKDSVYIANIAHIGMCALVGYANSSIILKIFGAGTKYVMDVIDKKTNIADGK